jgi:hypothetical protein
MTSRFSTSRFFRDFHPVYCSRTLLIPLPSSINIQYPSYYFSIAIAIPTMSPSQPSQVHLAQTANSSMESTQPKAYQPMSMSKLRSISLTTGGQAKLSLATGLQTKSETADQNNADALKLRGGEGEACPGRFCFCIPCPIPCNFCCI